MKAVRTVAGSATTGARHRGLSLVEVLVALAIMATVAAALFGLQAAGLRAARTAALTRQQAAELRYEAVLARVVAAAASTCRGEHVASTCTIVTSCIEESGPATDCHLRRTTIAVTPTDGHTVTATTVGYAPLEAAPVGVATDVEAP